MKILRDNGYGTTYTFEVVDKVPSNYIIWNIDFVDSMGGYIPFCEIIPGSRMVVNQQTLKAVRVDDKKIRKELQYWAGVTTGINLAWAERQIAITKRKNTLRAYNVLKEALKTVQY